MLSKFIESLLFKSCIPVPGSNLIIIILKTDTGLANMPCNITYNFSLGLTTFAAVKELPDYWQQGDFALVRPGIKKVRSVSKYPKTPQHNFFICFKINIPE